MKIPRLFLSGLLLLTVGLLVPVTTLAQTGAGSLTGIVSDQSGATVPGATVTATNQATNVDYTAVSNDAGNYTVTSMPVGIYVVKAELARFKTAATKPIQVEAMQIVRIDFKLELGALQETIEVVGTSPVLQTESVTVGEVISGTTLNALPLNGRNTGQLSLLLPGTITPNPSAFTNIRNFTNGRPYVNGNREQTNNYTFDGVDMNESIDNLVAYQPSPDALAEISVETNNYAADTGNVAGAVISNVSKSGSNLFRGDGFEYYRNSGMDANSWSNNRSHAPKPSRRQDIFGGTLGGPLVRNKLFFFGDYQGTRYDNPGSETVSVAPDTWRRGDLSSMSVTIRDPITGQPFAGNQIPAGRISPIASAILSNTSLYPLPNANVSGVQGNYVGPSLTTIRAHQGDVRMDWNLSTKDKIFGRFSFAEYESNNNKRAFPLLLGLQQTAPFRNLAVNWNRIFGPSIINEVLVGYNQITVVSTTLDWAGIGNANATFGIAGGQPIAGLSSLVLGSGLTSVGAGASDTNTLDKTYQINEKLTWIKGRQTLKFGGQLLHYVQQRFYAGNNGLLGIFSYSNFTGSSFSDFLLDQVLSKGRGSVSPPWTQLHNRTALFVQDDFKVTPVLTLNLGLRWAYTQPLVEQDNRQGNFDLTTGQEILAANGDRASRALYQPYAKGFEPRLGVAWHPRERWVVRGGYGISQYMEGTGANLRLPLNPPFFFESFVQYVSTGAGTLASGFADLQPQNQPSGQVRAWDPNLRPQFTQQWNVFTEYLLTPSTSVNVGYVGHHATHLVTPVEGNQPLPGVGDPSTWAPQQTRRPLYATAPLITNISTTASRGISNYNGLQTSVRQRTTKGLEYLASYTLSRILTNNLGYYGSTGVNAEGAYWMNAYRPDWNYGPAFFDARHNVVFSATYELPFGRGRTWGAQSSDIVNAVLGGWTVSGIFQAHTGFPVTIIDGATNLLSLQAVRGNERPNCIGDPTPADQNLNHWLDINAFARAAKGTWGNCGIGVARAPGYKNADAVLAKRIRTGGERYFEFRAEAFNLTNTPSFSPPARDINAPNTFGTITSTVSTARTVELVLKFVF
jgi:hypothetical protein